MIWFILIAVVGILIFSISKDYKKEVKDNVAKYGGMQNKYLKLVEYLTNGDFKRIKKITKDNITIEDDSKTTAIDYIGGNTEIRLKIKHPIYGYINKKWKFEHGYPQKRIINEMNFFLSKLNVDSFLEEDTETSIIDPNDYELNNSHENKFLNGATKKQNISENEKAGNEPHTDTEVNNIIKSIIEKNPEIKNIVQTDNMSTLKKHLADNPDVVDDFINKFADLGTNNSDKNQEGNKTDELQRK
jgi:hypothetical protein